MTVSPIGRRKVSGKRTTVQLAQLVKYWPSTTGSQVLFHVEGPELDKVQVVTPVQYTHVHHSQSIQSTGGSCKYCMAHYSDLLCLLSHWNAFWKTRERKRNQKLKQKKGNRMWVLLYILDRTSTVYLYHWKGIQKHTVLSKSWLSSKFSNEIHQINVWGQCLFSLKYFCSTFLFLFHIWPAQISQLRHEI